MNQPTVRRRIVRKSPPNLASNASNEVKPLSRLSKDANQNSHDGSLFFEINDDVLLSAGELARKLSVALKTIQKWRYENTMPSDCMVKVGKHLVRYRWANVRRWLQLQGD